MFFKVAACAAASLLVLISGCGPSAAGSNPPPIQVQEAAPSPIPTVIVRLVAAPTPTPAPAAAVMTPAPLPTPVVPAMPIPLPQGPPYVYHTVSEGETLSYIAMLYDTTIEELMTMNDLEGSGSFIQVDQELRVPVEIKTTAPRPVLLPDSEVVFGPSYAGFNVAEYVQRQAGYLAGYSERVDGRPLDGAQVVERVAEQFSVGPRLLLALLEFYGEWVTNPQPAAEQLRLPLGPHNPRGGSLYQAMAFTANRVNAGYYGYKRDGFWIFRLANSSRAITSQGANAGSVGVQNILAIHAGDTAEWEAAMGPKGFLAVYHRLFGDPAAHAFEPVVPATLTQPPLELPWAEGDGFYFTGGPHPAYADGSGWAAIDFGPPDVLGNCFYSAVPVTAAAAGVIVSARQGEVQLDLDGDGSIQTGWSLFYLHVALDAETPVQAGQRVAVGDVVGYASCEGGLSDSSHVHLARRYNGEWVEAGGPVPMELDGWTVEPNLVPYEGTIRKGDDIRSACECWEPEMNLIVNQGSR